MWEYFVFIVVLYGIPALSLAYVYHLASRGSIHPEAEIYPDVFYDIPVMKWMHKAIKDCEKPSIANYHKITNKNFRDDYIKYLDRFDSPCESWQIQDYLYELCNNEDRIWARSANLYGDYEIFVSKINEVENLKNFREFCNFELWKIHIIRKYCNKSETKYVFTKNQKQN